MKAALSWSLVGASILAGLLGEYEIALFLALSAIVAAIADVEVRPSRTAELEEAAARARRARARREDRA